MSRSINNAILTPDIVHVAIGLVIVDSQILVACRPVGASHAGLWEFPGGKFEANETAFEALKRELYEEVGIEVVQATPLMCVKHNYGKLYVALDTWQIDVFNGVPYGREGQEIRWVNRDELLSLRFPEGNVSIVDAVKTIL